MAGKADKTAKTPEGELVVEGTGEITTQPGDTQLTVSATAPDVPPVENSAGIGTMVPEEESVSERTAVVFLGPYHRYSRGDTACFDNAVSTQLVERRVAVWPKDAKKALAARPGAFDHDTDIG